MARRPIGIASEYFPLADDDAACAIQYVRMRSGKQKCDEPINSSHDDSSTGKRYDEMATKRESRERQNGRKYGEEAIAKNQLEAWPNPNPERDYVIHFEIPEFTCLCPRSGYPDFATIVIDYVPEGSIVELKSLKLYINGYRDRGISHEAVANTILDDLTGALSPRWMRVVAEFKVRGNIKTTIFAESAAPDYAGAKPAYQRPTFTGI